MRRAFIIAALAVMALLPRPVEGSGDDTHQAVARSAVLGLPEEMRPFFATCSAYLARHSTDPDTLKKKDPSQRSSHWLDIDHYGQYPFAKLPRDFDEAVKKYGRETVTEQGVLPWHLEKLTAELASAFRQRRWNDARLKASHLSHFVADAHVPFHATVNHNGQLTGNLGIHGRFEIELVNRYVSSDRIAVDPAKEIEDVVGFAFDTIIASNRLVPGVLKADNEARRKAALDTEPYYLYLYKGAGAVAQRRIREAATATASVWYTAWIRAGRPRLPPRRAVVIVLDRDEFDRNSLVNMGWKAARSLASELGPHDAIALRIANAPKRWWERAVPFRHATDVPGKSPVDGAPQATFSPYADIALSESLTALGGIPRAEKTLILLTDGLPDKFKPEEFANAVRRRKVAFACIAFGSREDNKALTQLAEKVGGRADFVPSLAGALRMIEKRPADFIHAKQPAEVAP